jgi:pimeloyl-ACP methyl ester carboxylesterase
MGSNMMRQAVPLLTSEAPIVGTGIEEQLVTDSRTQIVAEADGLVTYVDADYIRVAQTIHVEDEIDRYDGPVLLIHGGIDDVVPMAYVEKAAKLYKNVKLVVIPGAHHCYDGHLEELADTIRTFFKEHIE